MPDTEHSHDLPAAPRWRGEPFRIFFPLAVVLGWVGVGHWLLYTIGVSATYSCAVHSVVQMQAFMMAFAVGFLLTAIPRRTQAAPPSTFEMTAIGGALCVTTAGALTERWVIAQAAYAALFALLLQFAVRRFLGSGAGRRPPAAFVMIPIGVFHGLVGAVLSATTALSAAPAWAVGLGRLLVEQGVFLCFAIGVGSLVLPLMSGAPPPPDLGSSPRERWKALVYGVAGASIFLSLLIEQLGWIHAGPLLRAGVVGIGLGLGGGAWQAPGKPGLHRRLVWLAVWLMPLGLFASGVLPDYRVPALHILFIGGFGLLAFGVATHVAFSHLDLERLALGRPRWVAVVGMAFVLAMLARVIADWSETYFEHLAWGAGIWMIGSAVWLAFLGPRLLGRR
jgi:uncharacterized protein involved in response to NO